jgi:hypothetical protein
MDLGAQFQAPAVLLLEKGSEEYSTETWVGDGRGDERISCPHRDSKAGQLNRWRGPIPSTLSGPTYNK